LPIFDISFISITSVIFPVNSERSRIALNRHQEVKTVMNIWAKIPGFGRAQFSALELFFLCLVSPLLFAQASTSDIQQAAAAGNAQAQFAVANDYFRARYVTLNYAAILTWYRKSAAQGFAPAQNQLGSMYENNIGVPQNYKRAATYYRLAANQGFAPAQYNLAALFEAGRMLHPEDRSYSYRKARIGSDCMARRAGTKAASSATNRMPTVNAASIGQLRPFSPNSWLAANKFSP
jgi:hypothetical protein